MSKSEILGLHRITKKNLKDLCKKNKLYQTPHLNDQLYLHFQGFQSIENLEEYTGLKCLWLESNAISEIQGLDYQTELKCLFLQNNLIKKIENLQCCTFLDTLNLSSNHITKIENCGIDILPELSTLNLSRNYLQNSDAIRELENCKKLWSVDLSNNRIDDILVVKIFAKMPELRVLVLQGNPVVSKVPQYRKTLILECKNLTYLDSRPVFPKDRACAEAWKRGGYEEERKENDRWVRMDRKKTRDSVNATLLLRQKHGAGDIQLLESSDDENDKKEQNKLKKIPKDGTSSGDLEIIGVNTNLSTDLSNSCDSSSSTSSDDVATEKHGKNEKNTTIISKTVKKEDNCIDLSNKNDTNEFAELVLAEECNNCKKIVEDVIDTVLNEQNQTKDKYSQEPCEVNKLHGRENDLEISSMFKKIDCEELTAKNYYENFKMEEKIVFTSEDKDILQKFKENEEDNKMSLLTCDFSEQNKSTKSLASSLSSADSSKTFFDSKNDSSELEMKERVVCKSEDQEFLYDSTELKKENDPSLLFSSFSEFSEQNESTKSLSSSSSSSSESTVTKNSAPDDIENENFEKEMEENNDDSTSEDQELLQTLQETNKETDSSFLSMSASDFSELNEPPKSLSSSSYSDSKNCSSELKMEKIISCKSEDQKIPYELTETCKDTDSSFLSTSSFDLSEHNELTKSLSFSTSLTSSKPSLTELYLRNKYDNNELEKETDVAGPSEDLKFLLKSIETNKEKDSSTLSLSASDFSEQNETKSSSSESSSLFSRSSSSPSESSSESSSELSSESSSESSDSRSSRKLNENVNEMVLNEEYELGEACEDIIDEKEIYFEESGVISEFQKIESKYHSCMNHVQNSNIEIEDSLVSKSEGLKILQVSKENYKTNNKTVQENSGEKEFLTEELNLRNSENEYEYLKTSNDEKFNQNEEFSSNGNIHSPPDIPNILTETETFMKKLSIPLDDTEERLKNIFAMILEDEDSDTPLNLTTGILKNKTKIQQSSNWPFEDHNTDIFVSNEVVDESTNDSIWLDRDWHSEDTNASSWLEKLLVTESHQENSPPQRFIEELDNNDSCIALYDSTEDTIAADWLEENLCDEDSQQPLKEIIEELEIGNVLKDCEDTILECFDTSEEQEPKEISSYLVKNLENKITGNKTKEVQTSKVLNEGRSSNEQANQIQQSQNDISSVLKTPEKPKKKESSAMELKKELKQHGETDLLARRNDEKPQKEEERPTLIEMNKETYRTGAEDGSQDDSQTSSWWERTLAAARIDKTKTAPIANEDGRVEDTEDGSELMKSVEEIDDLGQREKHTSVPALEDQEDASNFLEGILEKIIDTEDKPALTKNSIFGEDKKISQKHEQDTSEVASGSQNSQKSLIPLEREDRPNPDDNDSSSSSDESSWEEPSSISTLREVVTTFNKVVDNISSRNFQKKSELLKGLIANPLTKTFSGQTAGDQINLQFEELKQQNREKLSNLVDCVYAQRQKYDDTLEVINGHLMVVKRSTGALEELPPPPSQRTGSTKYISCGVSTTLTSCNDNDDDDDECGTALSEDNHHDNYDDDYEGEENKNDIEQHASDTKIKSIPYSCCSLSDVNYCANESVSLSSSSLAGSSTEIEKDEEDNNHYHHHHSDDVDDDSQQRASAGTGRLHNKIDSEVVPESSVKWLEKEEAAAASEPEAPLGPADYKLSSSKGVTEGRTQGTQTRSEFQVELNDAIQSLMGDFGENAAALEDIALIFEKPEEGNE